MADRHDRCGSTSSRDLTVRCDLREGHQGRCVSQGGQFSWIEEHESDLAEDATEKPRFELIDPHALEAIARVLTDGAKRNGDFGWRERVTAEGGEEACIGSLMRHLNKLRSGEDLDSKSGSSHAAHIATRAMMLAFALRTRQQKESAR